MDHTNMDHSMMNHTGMDHSMMNHTDMDHSMMNHAGHNHNHTDMDHSMMNLTGHNHNLTGMSGNMNHHDHNCMGENVHAGHDMNNMNHMDMHGMKMYFHDGVNEYVLFKECETNSTETLIGACFAVFAVAVLYEGLKYFRESLLQRSLLQSSPRMHYLDGKQMGSSSQEQMVMQLGNTSMISRILSSGHFVQTLLHMVQVFISYCLMLVFMTYNVWLCLAVIVGAGVGYFLFGWKRAVVVDANEHCH
ncbi:high affinity copper uptake protein 1 [Plakobranchus ocellatus]|uniref:Copper transport protein n=1 Tax=Plakobranchus ocellatus TaxID=259542 RepID=A0AAV4AQP2_9GAST|nr:high affinity copper uptake protein 1 [Plakobranchus ocellatus]